MDEEYHRKQSRQRERDQLREEADSPGRGKKLANLYEQDDLTASEVPHNAG